MVQFVSFDHFVFFVSILPLNQFDQFSFKQMWMWISNSLWLTLNNNRTNSIFINLDKKFYIYNEYAYLYTIVFFSFSQLNSKAITVKNRYFSFDTTEMSKVQWTQNWGKWCQMTILSYGYFATIISNFFYYFFYLYLFAK